MKLAVVVASVVAAVGVVAVGCGSDDAAPVGSAGQAGSGGSEGGLGGSAGTAGKAAGGTGGVAGTGGSSGASGTSGTGGGGAPGACGDLVTSDPDIQQALPQTWLDTTWIAPTGQTIAVASGGDFQAALDKAVPGDVITLEAGASFTGPFTLPNKQGSGYIVIRSSADDASLPPAGTRIGPSYASALPKLLAPNTLPAIQAAPGAHHFRIMGVEITPVDAAAQIYTLVALGTGSETAASDLPHDIILDRVWVHGTPTGYTKRGVQLNSASTAVIDSYISDCHAEGQDAQAIGSFNGAGPFKIVNNYLEGSGENIIFGGADPKVPDLVPSDIEIRQNHFDKPLTWKVDDPSYAGKHWSVKNLLEFKNARRVLVRCNVFEHNWGDAQVGFAILLTPRNQDGTAPWSGVRDVTIQDNVIRHTASGINMAGEDDGQPSQQTSGVVIRNNLIHDVDGAKWNGDGRVFQVITPGTSKATSGPGRPIAGLKIDHNTAFVSGNSVLTAGDSVPVASSFFFQNNLVSHGSYGVFGSGKGEGTSALEAYFPGYVFVKNAIIGASASAYPADNFFPATTDEVGFVDFAGGDYHLAPTSTYKAAGTDGKDLGADIDQVLTGTSGVAP
ncbi:MAG: right-handed parallel beta-helix repeat-containing protein [Deltaproteobacteria bacterium]|nr:right-handed parallel beta-helix repeat-containing protein [Deltaproteobacteria bacterium]